MKIFSRETGRVDRNSKQRNEGKENESSSVSKPRRNSDKVVVKMDNKILKKKWKVSRGHIRGPPTTVYIMVEDSDLLAAAFDSKLDNFDTYSYDIRVSVDKIINDNHLNVYADTIVEDLMASEIETPYYSSIERPSFTAEGIGKTSLGMTVDTLSFTKYTFKAKASDMFNRMTCTKFADDFMIDIHIIEESQIVCTLLDRLIEKTITFYFAAV